MGDGTQALLSFSYSSINFNLNPANSLAEYIFPILQRLRYFVFVKFHNRIFWIYLSFIIWSLILPLWLSVAGFINIMSFKVDLWCYLDTFYFLLMKFEVFQIDIYFFSFVVFLVEALTRFGPKVGQTNPNETNPGLFQIKITYILARWAKMYSNVIWKGPGFVPFGGPSWPKFYPNLTPLFQTTH